MLRLDCPGGRGSSPAPRSYVARPFRVAKCPRCRSRPRIRMRVHGRRPAALPRAWVSPAGHHRGGSTASCALAAGGLARRRLRHRGNGAVAARDALPQRRRRPIRRLRLQWVRPVTSSVSTGSRCPVRSGISSRAARQWPPMRSNPATWCSSPRPPLARARGDRDRRRPVRPRPKLDRNRPRREPELVLLGAPFRRGAPIELMRVVGLRRERAVRGVEPRASGTGSCRIVLRVERLPRELLQRFDVEPVLFWRRRPVAAASLRCTAAGTTDTIGTWSQTTPP